MITNYSRRDTLRGNKAWGLPLCLAIAFTGLYFGVLRHFNNYNSNPHNPDSEIRTVQSRESQDFCSRNPKDLARLVNKYGGR